jgi:cAMP phosphodiesterase
LLQGKALSIEDAVDVLTLKDNTSTPEDFATALHLLARVQVRQHPKQLTVLYVHVDHLMPEFATNAQVFCFSHRLAPNLPARRVSISLSRIRLL